MNYLFSIFSAIFIASTVVAEEPIAAQYFAPKVTTDSGYTQTLLLPDGTLEYVVAFTTVNDESNPHTWQVPANVSKINYLVVAGGGGGGTGLGNAGGGGGGAGGMLTGTFTSISANTDFSICVGAGGVGGSGGNKVANNGKNSFIKGTTDIIAIGGGAGGSAISQDVANGSDGGSGGGGAGTGYSSSANYVPNPTSGGNGTDGQGNSGGGREDQVASTAKTNRAGAAGGGAGGKGENSKGTSGDACIANGGVGLESYITGASDWYAGGGAGGSYGADDRYGGAGGKGGGGRYNISGTAATGGGGGGARGARSGGSGGSGIVVLRYALNNDNFQGIAVDSTTEKFGTPSPAYGLYPTLPSSDVFACPRVSEVSEGVRAVCVGWELWSKDGAATEPIKEFSDDYRTTGRTSDLTYSRESGDEGVVLKWKFVKEYYVSTVASCERGSLVADKSGWYREGDTIQVAIISMDNFIGWGGWGTGAQRLIEQSKTITVVAAPMTITAYFTAHNKDNLVLNGDFEMSGNTSDSTTIDTTFSRLIGGIWESTQNSYTSYPTGLLSARSTGVANSGSKVISGNHSGIIGTKGKNTNYSGTASISCYVNIPCSGLYDLSFDADPGDVNATTWEISVYLQKNGSGEEVNVCNILQKDNASKANYPFEIQIRKGGIYKLIFKIERSKVYKNDVNDNVNAHSAIDNLMLKLKKRFGFALMVR